MPFDGVGINYSNNTIVLQREKSKEIPGEEKRTIKVERERARDPESGGERERRERESKRERDRRE